MPGGFLERFALMPEVTYAGIMGSLKKGPKAMSTRQSYVRRLKASGLLDSTSNDGAFRKWMHRFGERDIVSHVDEQLRLEEGKSSSRTRL
jgi:hypothetical protein